MVDLLHDVLVEHVLGLRFLKLCSVVLFSTGTIGCCLARDTATLNLFGWRVLPLGYFGTWLFGFALMWAQGRSVFTGWLLSVVLLSFVIGTVGMHAAMQEQLMGRRTKWVVASLLATCLWLMVTKPG